jgi:hypothetical protein
MERNTATTRREMAATVINLAHKPRPAFVVYIGRAQFCGEGFSLRRGPTPSAGGSRGAKGS